MDEKKKIVLKDFRKTKVIELPGFKGSEVVIYSSALLGDLKGKLDAYETADDVSNILPALIKEWNFTDEEGNDLPITPENMKKIPSAAAQFILMEVVKLASSEKKD